MKRLFPHTLRSTHVRHAARAALFLSLVVTLPTIAVGLDPAAPSLLDDVPRSVDLSAWYTDHELQVLEPGDLATRVAAGPVDLVLRGIPFRLVLEPVTFDTDIGILHHAPDGTQTVERLAYAPRAYVGHVEGELGSFARLVLTGSGASGRVQTEEHDIRFEPLRYLRTDAPAAVSVVHHAFEVIDRALHPEDETGPAPEPHDEPPAEGGFGASSYAPGDNRRLWLWVDTEAQTTGWQDKYSATYLSLNTEWKKMLGWEFSLVGNSLHACSSTCSETDVAALLLQIGNAAYAVKDTTTYDLVHLLSGKTTVKAVGGAGYGPGRYSLAAVKDLPQESIERRMAHEIGHNFNARHTLHATYLHYHRGAQVHMTHGTLMGGGVYENPDGFQESSYEFSSANANWIRACNLHSWSAGTKVPNSGQGFGTHCRSLRNVGAEGTEASYDATTLRGKLIRDVPQGDLKRLCAFVDAGGAGRLIEVQIKESPSGPVIHTDVIQADQAGWACKDIENPDFKWYHSQLFIYNTARYQHAAIAYAPASGTTPADGYAYDAVRDLWVPDSTIRGYRIVVDSHVLPVESCGVLASGASLAVDGHVKSCDAEKRYTLAHQGDGNVVFLDGTTPVWATNTVRSEPSNPDTTFFRMQADGDLVLVDGSTVLWRSNTAGNPGAWLSLRNDGRAVLYSKTGTILWGVTCGELRGGQELKRGETLKSCNRDYSLVHQTDGHVVVYRDSPEPRVAIWYNCEVDVASTTLAMQSDGNLVQYDGVTPVWHTVTDGEPGSTLTLSDTGRLSIHNSARQEIWYSGNLCTGTRAPS